MPRPSPFPPAFALDAGGKTGPVETKLLTADGKTRLLLSLDERWLKDAVYPVTLDPMVNTDPDAGGFMAGYVTSATPTTVYNNTVLRVCNSVY